MKKELEVVRQDLSTVQKCIDTYNDAEGIVQSYTDKYVEELKGIALIALKTVIVGHDLRKQPWKNIPTELRAPWLDALEKMDLVKVTAKGNRTEKTTVREHMKLHECRAGTDATISIPSVTQYKKIEKAYGGYAREIADTYERLAITYNDGQVFTAKLEQAIEEDTKATREIGIKEAAERLGIEVDELNEEELTKLVHTPSPYMEERLTLEYRQRKLKEGFLATYPNYEEAKSTYASMGATALINLSGVSAEDFKAFTVEASKVFHPDKGGNPALMQILNVIRDGVKDAGIFKTKENEEYMSAREQAWNAYANANGYGDILSKSSIDQIY